MKKDQIVVRIVLVTGLIGLAMILWGVSGCSQVNLPKDVRLEASEIQKMLAINSIDARDGKISVEGAAIVIEIVADWLEDVENTKATSPSFRSNARSHKLIFREQAGRIRKGDADLRYAAAVMTDAIIIVDIFRRADAGLPPREGVSK